MSDTVILRVAPDRIAADREALRNLRALTDYAPRKPELTLEALVALEAALTRCMEAEAQAVTALDHLHEQTIAAAFALHMAMGEVRQEIKTQYGKNSVALHAVGLKKRSEYKRPVRRKKDEG